MNKYVLTACTVIALAYGIAWYNAAKDCTLRGGVLVKGQTQFWECVRKQ